MEWTCLIVLIILFLFVSFSLFLNKNVERVSSGIWLFGYIFFVFVFCSDSFPRNKEKKKSEKTYVLNCHPLFHLLPCTLFLSYLLQPFFFCTFLCVPLTSVNPTLFLPYKLILTVFLQWQSSIVFPFSYSLFFIPKPPSSCLFFQSQPHPVLTLPSMTCTPHPLSVWWEYHQMKSWRWNTRGDRGKHIYGQQWNKPNQRK